MEKNYSSHFLWSLKKYLIFLLIPILYLYIGFESFSTLGSFYLRAIDPEYAYLYNGLNVARFDLWLGHVDHPGSPLQFLIAVNIWIIQLFNMDQSMIENVVSNPELYLTSTYFSILFINAFAIFSIGFIVRKAYPLSLSLFIQIIPFVPTYYMLFIERVRPESMQIITLLLFSCTTIMYYSREKYSLKSIHYTILYGITAGFGSALKISSFPLYIIPLLLISERKQKLNYLGYWAIGFFVFGLPAIIRHNRFTSWITSMITHSGSYGHGEESFLDPVVFTNNLLGIINHYKYIIIIQIIAVVFFLFVRYIKKRNDFQIQLFIKLVLSFSFALTIQCLLVSKHYFSEHYLVPIISLFILEVFFMLDILYKMLPKKQFLLKTLSIKIIATTFIIAIIVNTKITKDHKIQIHKKENLLITKYKLDSIRNGQPIFITSEGYGDACIESASYFGYLWAGSSRKHYKKQLQNTFPNSYIYDTWYKQFFFWYDELDSAKLISDKDKNAILYLGKDDQSTKDLITNKLMGLYQDTLFLDLIYLNPEKDEAIYNISFSDSTNYNKPISSL